MSNDRTYYRAEGRSLERVKEWQEAEQAAQEQMIAFAKRFGVTRFKVYNDPYRFGGLVFDGDAPKGWRTYKDGSSVPRRDTKAGKELHKEMAQICGKDFDLLIGGDLFMIVGNRRKTCGFEMVGDAYIVSVPNRENGEPFFIPEDAVPLKTSEYWALKEAEEVTA